MSKYKHGNLLSSLLSKRYSYLGKIFKTQGRGLNKEVMKNLKMLNKFSLRELRDDRTQFDLCLRFITRRIIAITTKFQQF